MDNIPHHVAIIPDGNRRWAKAKGLPTFEGHRRGFDRIAKITKSAREIGIKVLTIFAFSTENWQRSTEEVKYLMRLYELMFDLHLKEALKNQVRLVHLGRKDRLNQSLLKKIQQAEEATKKFRQNYLAIALDYGGRDEVIRAIKRAQSSRQRPASTRRKRGERGSPMAAKFKIESLDENNFNQFLDTRDLPYPNVDLLIRTSGEERTSGFMIWQAAYAEYIFHKKHMPDFTTDDFAECIKEYQNRQRRYGR